MNLNNFHKHVSHEIYKRGEHPVILKVPPSQDQEQLTEILKQTNNKELTSFLSQYADKHPDFHQALLSTLHPKKKAAPQVNYAKEIQKCFKHSYDNYGFRNGGQAIAHKLDSYIEKAKSLIKLNCQEEAMTILLHIIREIGDGYEEYDDFDNSIHILDEALKNEPDSFRTSSLVMSKIELLENVGKNEEVEKVISSYLYLPEIRKIRLKELISKKQYENVLALIDEGISLAEQKKHSGTVSDWKDEKLSVYQLTRSKEKIIELAEDLFITGRDSMKYYYILKKVIPTEKWAKYLDDFLCKSTKQKAWGLGHVLAEIYIAEEYWDRLMEYVEKNIQLGKYSSLVEYESYLKPHYPERILAFYRSQITDYAAKNMGRDHYIYVADILKTMKKYPGGNEAVNTLLAHFKSVYSNRRAMMEEPGK